MKSTLEDAGVTALRDLRHQAPPVYLLAQMAAVFKPLPPLGRSAAAAGTALLSIAAAGFVVRSAARAAWRA